MKQVIGLSLIIALLCCASSISAAQGRYALVNVNVFDGISENINEDATVLVADGQIERIGNADMNIPAGYEQIDCDGNFLMPGLFDVHTHLDNVAAAERALASGVTTVRSASVSGFQDVALRELVRKGVLAGPDVMAAGVYVTPNLGDTVLADPRLAELADGITTDEDLRLLVDINVSRGVDVIKTRGTERAGLPDTDPRKQVYTERQLRIVVEEAARHEIPVLVHAHGDEGARAAVLAGARSIEHGTYLSEETLQLMKSRGTWFVPTWITMYEMNEEKYDYVLRLRGHHMVPNLEDAIRTAHRLGVRVATGADSYYQVDSINRISLEVEKLIDLGFSNLEALQAATVSSAELLGVADRTGRIAPGYEADMILLPGNPLENINALHDVLFVMSNGVPAIKRIPFAINSE
jgi:imidazolonepropionase-like amidohydrolase